MEKGKAYMDWRDICARYECSKGKAYGIISAIRQFCHETVLPVGKVTPEEVEYWETNHHLREVWQAPPKKEDPLKKPDPQPTQKLSRAHDILRPSVCIPQPYPRRR